MHVRNSDYMSCETDLQPRSAVFQRQNRKYYKILALVCAMIIVFVVVVVLTTTRASNEPLCRVSTGTLGCGLFLFDKTRPLSLLYVYNY